MKAATGMARCPGILLAPLVLCAACPPPETYVDSKAPATNASAHLISGGLNGTTNSSTTPIDRNYDPVSKRWYSVFDLDHISQQPGGLRAAKHAPWPQTCGRSWVRFCFKNEHSADHLVDVVAHAIAMWQPAALYSGMNIVPDLACYEPVTQIWDYRCVCRHDQ